MNRLWLIGIGIFLASSAALAVNPGPDGIIGTPDDIVEEGEEVEEDEWSKASKLQRGTIDYNMSQRVSGKLDSSIKKCQERSIERSEGSTDAAKKIDGNGTLVVKYIILQDGSISELHTDKDTVHDPLFEECILEVLRKAPYEPLRNTDKIYYTYTFGVGGGNPINFFTGLNHSVGSGILGAGKTNAPTLRTSIPLGMRWALPKVPHLPPMGIILGTGVGIQWLTNNQNVTFDRVPRVGDLSATLGFGNFLKNGLINDHEWSKLNLTGNVGVRAPLSLFSRTQNLVAGFGAGASVFYNLSSLPGLNSINETIGNFGISYSPRVGANWYSQNSGSIPCDAPPEFGSALQGTGDPTTDITIPSRIPRAREILSNGECRLIGRQNVFNISQNVGFNWRLKKHSVNIGLGIGHAFARPLVEDGTAGKFATGQNFSESTNGSVAYSYTLPMGWAKFGRFSPSSILTAGIQSGQPIYTFDGSSIRFPFWDFISPQNQFSSAFLNLGLNF